MRIYKYIKLFFHLIFFVNLSKTFFVNFKMLPLTQAVKLPIFVYGKMQFRSMKGIIEIEGKVYTGMIKIGRNRSYVTTSIQLSTWIIDGKIIFHGTVNFYYGSYLLVAPNAVLTIGRKTSLGNVKLICFQSITIGENVRFAWECQLMDTSFHYLEQENGEIQPLTESITIGSYTWIGNRSSITKGAIIPTYSIITSNSVVNKDMSSYGTCCLFAGQPAKFKKNGIKRVYDMNFERELDKKFGYERIHL